MSFESKNAVYRQGHFYDAVTNKRIELLDEAQVCMVATIGSFKDAGPVGKISKKRSSYEMETEIKSVKKLKTYEKFAPADTALYFSLDRGKHKFKVILSEDLYLYNCTDWKNPDDLSFYDCACQVVENINGSLNSFEPVFGSSISDLYKTAYIHYLQNNGNPARNAVSVFYWDEKLTDKIEDRKNKIKRMQALSVKAKVLKEQLELL